MSEVMKFELASKNGVLLETEGKYCTHNIKVEPVVDDLTITENGTYPVPEGHTGHGDLTVDVQNKLTNVTLTENGTHPVPEGYYGYGEVTVDVQPELEPLTAAHNGTYPVPEDKYGYGEVTVDVNVFPCTREYEIIAGETLYVYIRELSGPDFQVGFANSWPRLTAVSLHPGLSVNATAGAFAPYGITKPFESIVPAVNDPSECNEAYKDSLIRIEYTGRGSYYGVRGPIDIYDVRTGPRARLWVTIKGD